MQSDSEDLIRCPHCAGQFPITVALRRQIEERARQEVLQNNLKAQQDLDERETRIQEREDDLRKSEKKIEERIAEELQAESERIAADARKRAREELELELKTLHEAAAEKSEQVRQFQEQELALRREKRTLEESQKSLELDLERRLDEERQAIRTAAAEERDRHYQLKHAEKDKQLADALRVNDELRRKLEQGSQQSQGEVFEVALEDWLQEAFPSDEVVSVPTGSQGADVIHRVRTQGGIICGRIVWEAKRTKHWNEQWIHKLREDQRNAKADVAIIVSEALPKDMDRFGMRGEVWVTDFPSLLGLTTAIRKSLIEVALTKRAVASKDSTVEVLFEYLTGPEFRHRVEAIVRTYTEMRQELEEEKRIAARRWARRDKQLDLVIDSASGMYGDLQGLIGAPMKSIPSLEASIDTDDSE